MRSKHEKDVTSRRDLATQDMLQTLAKLNETYGEEAIQHLAELPNHRCIRCGDYACFPGKHFCSDCIEEMKSEE